LLELKVNSDLTLTYAVKVGNLGEHMQNRKYPLVSNQIYHIFSKSIANYTIFNTKHDYLRMKDLLTFYNSSKISVSYSQKMYNKEDIVIQKIKIVQIIAYCIMPTHLHLLLKQITDNGISTFMNNILNSYTRFFNLLHKRKGPLWESRFKNVPVETNEQLLHLTRYIHLNPTTAFLTALPEEWLYSSYNEYISNSTDNTICEHTGLIELTPQLYKNFVNDNLFYQQQLSIIKKQIFE